MPVPALRLEQPTFRKSIANYVTAKCRPYRVPCVDVDDLTQEAMINILAKLNTFQPEKSEFEQWARGIAWNVIREYFRKTKLYFAIFTEYLPNVHDYPSHEHSPERCARRKQAGCAIVNAAESISPQQVQVLVSHVVYDMSHKEIGLELNISEANSQKCYQRARHHLALCISDDAFSIMPPFVAGCDEPVSFNKNGSRLTERSHYAGQIVASILAFLFFVPSCFEPQNHASMTGETRVLGPVQNAVMYRSDERSAVHDEPRVYRDAPNVKPEPAFLPSVRDVSAPTRSGDKLTYVQDPAPLPPFKPTESTTAHLPPGR
jgi:RNA polymerase sigma factor (sigma-70 family)